MRRGEARFRLKKKTSCSPGLPGITVSSFVTDNESQSSEIIEDLLMTGTFEFGNFSLKSILGVSNYNYIYRYSSIRADNTPGFDNDPSGAYNVVVAKVTVAGDKYTITKWDNTTIGPFKSANVNSSRPLNYRR